jgi:LysM repeat protein
MTKAKVFFGALVAVAAMTFAGGQASAATVATVEVQPGNTLSGIAKDHSTTYVRLFNANPDIAHPDTIHVGDSVRVPSADEQLPDRALPGAAPVAKPVATSKPAAKAKPTADAAAPTSGDVWDKLAYCESRGNWSINTGNGYYGGLQFSMSTWTGNGGTGSPAAASRETQIEIAKKVQANQGWKAWPACAKKLGLL